MKIRQKKKAAVIITSLLAAVLLASGLLFAPGMQNNSQTDEESPATSDAPKQDTSSTEPKDVPASNGKPPTKQPNAGTDTPPAPVPGSSGKSSVEVAITSTHQQSATFQIRTVIYSVQGSGTCTISLNRSGYTTVTQSADIQPLPTTSTCKGFDIPLSQLTAGSWLATLTFNNNSVSGTTTKTITISEQTP